MTEVFINGKFVGNVDDREAFVENVLTERRKSKFNHNINVQEDSELDTVYVECSKGRMRRPLVVVKDGKPLLTEKHLQQLENNEVTWSDLLDQGIIEYLDASEEENVLSAFTVGELTPEHTHLEIAPMGILGLCASLVPFANHSPPARINMGAKNQKQALGYYAANYHLRMDMDVNLLFTPQNPICKTMMHDLSAYDKHPSGQNIVVAVMSYKGYNMEDAIILNRGSIDRGVGRSAYYRPVITEELRYSGGLIDEISIPDKEVKGYRTETEYRLLEDDGIVFPEAKVKEEDVVIGKTSPPRFLSGTDEYNLSSNMRREASSSLKHGQQGVIDFVTLSENEEGNKIVQVRIRDQRIPEVGDKFTSRHGQKGVVGLVVDPSDMPFSASGVVPDLIFSPHGIPSRMTMSHLIELVGSKAGAMSGRFIDGTIFDSEKETEIRKELLSCGFREDGTETLYNGMTGEQLEAKIFIGNMYYLKLRHMVANKIHSRARGPIQLLTRQPTEGRALEGGLRLGEMEKDTFVAHGASLLLKERFDADKTIVPVCEECGLIAVYDEYKRQSFCPVCGENVKISNVEVAYAFKLLMDELKSLGFYPNMTLKDKY